ncbi:unnamed protein product [Euphydryas editha]|uniref:PiggyBac transposable element-derived protein domain-containing protein n=1 Tax=Euphydryas editha TaxID=104508 RepID=A0AAU9UPJ7_EUPED|nr:unnamed protein product [Euphydryas editha]
MSEEQGERMHQDFASLKSATRVIHQRRALKRNKPKAIWNLHETSFSKDSKLETDPKNHQIFLDNFFTNYNLLVDLKREGYRATGTIRENRIKKCPLRSTKEMKKEDRASYDYRFDKQNEILLVRWKDNSVCTIATNYDTIEPLGVVKRWPPVQCEIIDVNIPKLFQTYNKNMGGVDKE